MIPEPCHREDMDPFAVTVHHLKPGETLPHTVTLPDRRVFDLSLPRLANLNGDVFAVRLTCEDPARKPTLDGLAPLAPELHQRLTHAVYRAYAAVPDSCPTYDTWSRAAEAGIRMAPASPRLIPWTPVHPSVPVGFRQYLYPPPEDLPQDQPCFLMNLPRLSAASAQTVHRAVEGRKAFFHPNPLCDGYDWYQDIPEVARVTFHFKDNGGWNQVGRTPLPDGRLADRAMIRFHSAATGVLTELPTDLLIFHDDGQPAWMTLPTTPLSAEEIGAWLFEAFRDPEADRLDDLNLRARLNLEAADLLGVFDRQVAKEIRQAVKRSLGWLAPYGRTYWIAANGIDACSSPQPRLQAGFHG